MNHMSSGATGLDLGIFHEHGFYEDGSGDNTGFAQDGLFDDSENADEYQCSNESYDDDIIRKAADNIKDNWQDGYNVFTNNCQDYITDLLNEYERIQNPPTCRMTSRGMRCN